MQVIHQNEAKRKHSGRVDTMGVDICVRRIGRCVEGKCDGITRSRRGRIRVGRRIFYSTKKGIRCRRRRIGESSGVKKDGARRKNDGRIHAGVQEGGERE